MALPFKYTRLLSSRKRQHKKSLHTKLRYSESAEKEKKGKDQPIVLPFTPSVQSYIGDISALTQLTTQIRTAGKFWAENPLQALFCSPPQESHV